jgi:hypothetical protein
MIVYSWTARPDTHRIGRIAGAAMKSALPLARMNGTPSESQRFKLTPQRDANQRETRAIRGVASPDPATWHGD